MFLPVLQHYRPALLTDIHEKITAAVIVITACGWFLRKQAQA